MSLRLDVSAMQKDVDPLQQPQPNSHGLLDIHGR